MDKLTKALFILAILSFIFLGSGGSASGQITLKVIFDPPFAERGVANFDVVKMPKLRLAGDPGLPVLPVKTLRILMPQGEEVAAIHVIPGERFQLKGRFWIEPGQMPVPISREEAIEFTAPNVEIYRQTSPFPARSYRVVSVETLRGYRVFLLNLYPLVYVPGTGKSSITERCLFRW